MDVAIIVGHSSLAAGSPIPPRVIQPAAILPVAQSASPSAPVSATPLLLRNLSLIRRRAPLANARGTVSPSSPGTNPLQLLLQLMTPFQGHPMAMPLWTTHHQLQVHDGSNPKPHPRTSGGRSSSFGMGPPVTLPTALRRTLLRATSLVSIRICIVVWCL